MNPQLIELHRYIISRIEATAETASQRDFNLLLTTLMSDINDFSENRMDARQIVERMLHRLNTDEDGNLIENLWDTRWTSPDFQRYMPIAISLTELAELAEVFRAQSLAYTATGPNLDDLGRDYDFPRFEATQAIRQGFTLDTQGNMADFPAGGRFMTRDTVQPLIFSIERTENGYVLFRSETYGDVGNTYYGDLSPASPISGIGRATITDSAGAYIPGQNRETDEQYRRRFLRFLRRRAFGGNVAQYQQEIQRIEGVGDSIIFPVWRGDGTVKIVIVDTANQPVSEEFVTIVNNLIDPVTRSGAGFSIAPTRYNAQYGQLTELVDRLDSDRANFGIAPMGHRVFVDTPRWLDIDVHIRIVLVHDFQFGQVEQRFNEVIEQYITEIRQAVIGEWERTYFANEGISIAWVNVREKFEAKAAQHNDPEILDLAYYFEAGRAIQTHTWYNIIFPHVIGVRLLETRLISAIDFENILINGTFDPNGLRIEQSQEDVWMPRVNNVHIEVVDYIPPVTPPEIPPEGIVLKRFATGFDRPMSDLVEVEENA